MGEPAVVCQTSKGWIRVCMHRPGRRSPWPLPHAPWAVRTRLHQPPPHTLPIGLQEAVGKTNSGPMFPTTDETWQAFKAVKTVLAKGTGKK